MPYNNFIVVRLSDPDLRSSTAAHPLSENDPPQTPAVNLHQAGANEENPPRWQHEYHGDDTLSWQHEYDEDIPNLQDEDENGIPNMQDEDDEDDIHNGEDDSHDGEDYTHADEDDTHDGETQDDEDDTLNWQDEDDDDTQDDMDDTQFDEDDAQDDTDTQNDMDDTHNDTDDTQDDTDDTQEDTDDTQEDTDDTQEDTYNTQEDTDDTQDDTDDTQDDMDDTQDDMDDTQDDTDDTQDDTDYTPDEDGTPDRQPNEDDIPHWAHEEESDGVTCWQWKHNLPFLHHHLELHLRSSLHHNQVCLNCQLLPTHTISRHTNIVSQSASHSQATAQTSTSSSVPSHHLPLTHTISRHTNIANQGASHSQATAQTSSVPGQSHVQSPPNVLVSTPLTTLVNSWCHLTNTGHLQCTCQPPCTTHAATSVPAGVLSRILSLSRFPR